MIHREPDGVGELCLLLHVQSHSFDQSAIQGDEAILHDHP
jgi:hypothetical protein